MYILNEMLAALDQSKQRNNVFTYSEAVSKHVQPATFPLINKLLDDEAYNDVVQASADKQYEFALYVLASPDLAEYFDENVIGLIKFDLGLHASTARILAQYALFQSQFPGNQADECKICVVWHDKVFDSVAKLNKAVGGDSTSDLSSTGFVFSRSSSYIAFSLKRLLLPRSKLSRPRLYRFDHAYSHAKSYAPVAILYADITHQDFREFHQALVKLSDRGVTCIFRHRPSSDASDASPMIMPAYGLELALKRTDYLVIDDREHPEGISCSRVSPICITRLTKGFKYPRDCPSQRTLMRMHFPRYLTSSPMKSSLLQKRTFRASIATLIFTVCKLLLTPSSSSRNTRHVVYSKFAVTAQNNEILFGQFSFASK